MKKVLFILSLFMAVTTVLQAQGSRMNMPQNNPVAAQPSRVFFGGGLGLTFGNYTRIAINPMVGYRFTPKISGGLRANYEYIRDKRFSPVLEGSNYGGSLFGRYRIIPQAYAHAEFAYNSYTFLNFNGDTFRNWVPFLFLGGGYVQPIGGNTAFYVELLFDVLNDANSPYQRWNPFISMGVGVGL